MYPELTLADCVVKRLAPAPGCATMLRDNTRIRGHRRSAQLVHRGDAGLDHGRLRLLHRGVRLCRYRKDFPPQQGRSRVHHDGHPGHAPGGRAAVRAVGRPGRPSAAADGGRDVLLGGRIPVRVRAELHRAGDPAPAVRHRHGRRMGAGRRARHGEGSRRAARLLLRAAAGGLRVRLSAGERGIAGGDELAGIVVALVVRPVHHPGPDQPDHPVPGAGIRGMGSRPGPDEADQHQNPRRAARRRDHPPVHLPGAADDRLQLDEPRHPGRLPDLPGRRPPTTAPGCPA